MAEIVLDHVVKRYPEGALAVDDFNLEIADGEFIILVGPSGCGKSTTLNMVAGLEDITAGKLIIDGTVVNDKAPKDRDIAMVFQSYALYPHMTVGENMGFPLKLAGIDKGTLEERFDSDFSKGSVVGKTGTLGNTDGGVSALAGEVNTRSGKLLFVIFNQRGSVSRFRSFQNLYVSLIQGQFGGAAALDYTPIDIDSRLARTRIEYPNLEASLD